eukprot:4290650-Amphidinium_carterae.2
MYSGCADCVVDGCKLVGCELGWNVQRGSGAIRGYGADILCTARQGLWRWLAQRPVLLPVEHSPLLLSIVLHQRRKFHCWCAAALVVVWRVCLAAAGGAAWVA